MKTVKGDLIALAIEGKFQVIVHGCNCHCTMGAGIAKTIKQKFPEVYQADCATIKGERSKLGTITYSEVQQEGSIFHVVNGYTQFNWRGRGVLADYDAIRSVFRLVKQQFSGMTIGYPLIGAGLAKGDWTIISSIIDEELIGEDHTLVEFSP